MKASPDLRPDLRAIANNPRLLKKRLLGFCKISSGRNTSFSF